MYNIKTTNADFLFSPNHKLVCKHDGNKYLKLKTIDNLNFNSNHNRLLIPKTCVWEGKIDKEFFIFKYKNKELKILLDDWLQFLGWFISEGFIHTSNTNEFGISQKKKENNRKELQNLFNKIGLNYWCGHPVDFIFCIKDINDYLKKECYNGTELKNGHISVYNCYNKIVPSFIKKLPTEKIEIFLNAFNKGDGWKSWNNSSGYFTTSKQLSDDIQELIIKCGKSFSVWEINREGYHVGWRIEEKKSINYCINVKENIKKIPYKGIIWDVETNPHHNILIRRKGHVMWTGNSMQWIFLTIATVITGFLGGYIAEHYTYRTAFLILIPIYLIVIGIVSLYKSKQPIIQTKKTHILEQMKVLFTDKKLLLVCLVIFLYKFSPSFGTPLMFIMRDTFGWKATTIGLLETVSAIVSIGGALLYFKFSKKLNMMKWLKWSVVVGAICSLSYLYFTPVSCVVYNIIFSFMGMAISLLLLDFMARNSKSGLEATSFALLCSVSNLAATCSGFAGSWLFPIVGLKWLIVISSFASFTCLLVLPFIKEEK